MLNTIDQSEEASLLSGDGSSNYIGQVNAIPDLCIPAINMEDGPSGVGDGNGGVTAFPDGENAAATWDPGLIEQEGAAMGAEFAGKGVNVSLGPTTNLVRDPRWGRTYETYGEDPYLAGQITSAEVEGIQSQGVMAMVKHVAAYDQEQYPNGDDNETVSQQALEELYLAPFQTAVRAGRAGRDDVLLRCGQQRLLLRERRPPAGRAWTTRRTTAASSPPTGAPPVPPSRDAEAGHGRRDAVLRCERRDRRPLGRHAEPRRSSTRSCPQILTQMFAFGMFDNAQTGSLSNTVTTAAHQQTALQLGEEGTVLLKNNGILPLNPRPHQRGDDRGDRHRRRRRGRAGRRW